MHTWAAAAVLAMVMLWLHRRRKHQRDLVARERVRRRAEAIEQQQRAEEERRRAVEQERAAQRREEELLRAREEAQRQRAIEVQRLAVAQRTGVLAGSLPAWQPAASLAALSTSLRSLSLVDASVRDEQLDAVLSEITFERLKTLDLSGNHLSRLWLERAPWRLPALERLHAARNAALETIPACGWDGVAKLRELQLSNCSLQSLPAGFEALTSCTVLSAGSNRLTVLPPQLGGMKSLRELDLSRNCLTALPTHIAAITSLRTLNVENNALESFPPDIFALESLEHIRIAGNEKLILKELDGVDAYLLRRRRRVVQDGQVLAFCDLEIKHQKEMEKREALRREKEMERIGLRSRGGGAAGGEGALDSSGGDG